jgi:hypothetical protein
MSLMNKNTRPAAMAIATSVPSPYDSMSLTIAPP